MPDEALSVGNAVLLAKAGTGVDRFRNEYKTVILQHGIGGIGVDTVLFGARLGEFALKAIR
jgi:hypothetical protein